MLTIAAAYIICGLIYTAVASAVALATHDRWCER